MSRILLTEYGSLLQQAAEKAFTIEDRDQRTAYANVVVNLMSSLNPKARQIPEFQTKVWNQFAYMTDYKLDIDWPVKIMRPEDKLPPHRIPYDVNQIKLRQYGSLVEKMLEQASRLEDQEQQKVAVEAISERMRKILKVKKGSSADLRVENDVKQYMEDFSAGNKE